MNLHIVDGYKINKLTDMETYLLQHKDELSSSRSLKSYLIEWRAHNVLYYLGLFRSHTKDTDLDDHESMFRRFIYWLIWVFTLSFVEYNKKEKYTMNNKNIKSPKIGTIIRTVLQILAYANQVVALIGQTTFASAVWYQWVSFGVTLAITIISYWYNNDWTNFAKVSSEIFDMLKDGKITEDEVKKFLDNHNKKGE